jgi:hypothetical protein
MADSNGKKTGGKKKGFQSAHTASFKDAYLEVFERLGGVEGFAQWAGETASNKRIFYQMGKAMLPKEIFVKNGETPESLPFRMTIESEDKE